MESLEDIQVGEVVVVLRSYSDKDVDKVARVTKQHFTVERSHLQYRKATALQAGDHGGGWHRFVVRRPKPGEVEEIEADRAARDDRYFVEKHIESIRHTPAAFVPIAKFIKENMKPEKDDA
jgi:hypothetical protein